LKDYLKEIGKRKDLLFYLVTSGLKAEHRNSFLGYFWWLLDPLLNVAIYYFVVVIIFKRGGPNFGPYLVVGMIIWRWVNTTIRRSAVAIVSQAGIIAQINLPKVIFPFGIALSQLINFGFGLVVIAIFLLFLKIVPGVELAWLPVIVLVNLLFLLAIAMILSFIGVFFRDIDNLVGHLLRLWFFASPVIWESRNFPEKINWLIQLNPLAHFLTAYRNIFIFHAAPNIGPLLAIGAASLVVIVLMLIIFNKHEHKIIKVL